MSPFFRPRERSRRVARATASTPLDGCWLDPRAIFRARVAVGRRARARAFGLRRDRAALFVGVARRAIDAVSGRARACDDLIRSQGCRVLEMS